MALFKVSKGLKANLPSAKTEGYCWYTTDDSLFYIDYKDENGTLQRKALNAKDAETLTGASLSTILNSSDVEIPTSKAVLDALDGKVDKVDAGSTTQPVYFKDGVPTVINTLDSVAFDGYVTKGKKSGTTVGSKATAEGKDNTASGNYSHAEGNYTTSSGQYSHSEGYKTTARGTSSHSEGYSSKVVPDTITSSTSNADIITEWNSGSFAFANGPYSHVEGWDNLALGSGSHAEGRTTISSGTSSHSEGFGTVASEYGSHAEGWSTTSSNYASHSEGRETTASGNNSHAEGYGTLSSGENSHAEGVSTVASGRGSHAEGEGTSAMSALQHVEGKYNIKDYTKYAHIVGNGTSDEARSNAHTLDWNGVGWFKDSVKVGGSSQDDSNAKTLATTDYVDTTVSGKVDKVDGKGLSTNDYTTTEKNKLAGIEAGANNYSLPVATSTSLGGVKSGTDITVDSSGNVSVNDDSHNHIISNIDNLQSTLDSKVDSVDGKGLSTNDYTTAEKNKLAGIDTGANKTIVDSALSSTSTNPVQNKVVNTALAGKSNTSHTHTLNNLDGTLGASKGGTGTDLSEAAANAVVCKASSGQNLATVSTAKGAFYATDANATPKFGTLPVAEGGTGATSASAARTNLGFTYGTAEPTGTPSTGDGSIYFMEDDGSPLSIAEGGTGASTASAARTNLGLNRIDVTPTLSTTNNVNGNSSSANIRIIPGLRLAILRCGVVTKRQFSADYTYYIATIPDEYAPASSFGLGVYTENGLVNARYNASDKVIALRIKETVASGATIYVSGIWYY